MQPPLTTPFRIGDVDVANRVLLAPLAGIGNWFVRLQARRHGAGLAVSEMVSSFGLHYRNERTMTELLRIHPSEHPVSIQLFGHDPEVMASAAAIAAEAGADLIDINMGCPVRKVREGGRRRGAPAIGPTSPSRSRGRPPGLGPPGHGEAPLRTSTPATAPASTSPFAWSRRPASRRSRFIPRSAAVQHKGEPDYGLVRELVERLDGRR